MLISAFALPVLTFLCIILPMDITPRNDFTRIVGVHMCQAQPERRGLHTCAYPWAHMQPGSLFVLEDPSPEARTRLAAASSAYGRKHGMRFSTGIALDDAGGIEPVHIGWWCVRHDGCELLPATPTKKQQRAAEARAELAKAKLDKLIARKRPPRPEMASRIGDYAIDAQGPVDHVPADEADQWMRPRPAGEVF